MADITYTKTNLKFEPANKFEAISDMKVAQEIHDLLVGQGKKSPEVETLVASFNGATLMFILYDVQDGLDVEFVL